MRKIGSRQLKRLRGLGFVLVDLAGVLLVATRLELLDAVFGLLFLGLAGGVVIGSHQLSILCVTIGAIVPHLRVQSHSEATSTHEREIFLGNLGMGDHDEALKKDLARELAECVSHPDLFTMDARTMEICERWGSLCHRLYHAYQECALGEIETGAGVGAE